MKWLVYLLCVAMAALISLHVKSCREGFREKSPMAEELDTLRDTVLDVRPVAVRDTVTCHETVFIPIERADTVFTPVTRTVTRRETVRARIPISSKTYRDSQYYAVVSGYRASLDTLRVFRKTLLRTVYKPKYRRWTFGVTAGYGYGILHGKPDLFIGAGVKYHFK